jgi:hopene-associated glycosyltransferase HpnB
MDTILIIGCILSSVSLLIWLYLIVGRGFFWKFDQRLHISDEKDTATGDLPTACVVIPARNERKLLEKTLPFLLRQNYTGRFHIFLVDDCSTDGTAALARQIATNMDANHRLTVVSGRPLPPGWTGKLWALQQGTLAVQKKNPTFLMFTDADILHSTQSLQSIVQKAVQKEIVLLSTMVKLKVTNRWEQLLIPAFVFFFAKLYPFSWVNDPGRKTAAAAGGCVLLRRNALENMGGLKTLSSALIDDVTLAKRIKGIAGETCNEIWLGLAEEIVSLRQYQGIRGVWQMVARTAYTQLKHSPLHLAATILGMLLTYLMPLMGTVLGFVIIWVNGTVFHSWWIFISAVAGWSLMAVAFRPILEWYESPRYMAFLLPIAGLLYTLMTIDSAVQHYRGQGGYWKGRTYRS